MLKPLTVWITTNTGKFLKRWEYQTTIAVGPEVLGYELRANLGIIDTSCKNRKNSFNSPKSQLGYNYLHCRVDQVCNLKKNVSKEKIEIIRKYLM